MTVKSVNLKSLLFSDVLAGYAIFFIDYHFAGLFGLFGLFPANTNVWWFIEHHMDSILFSFLFAWPFVYYKLPGPKWLKGAIFGLGWAVMLIIVTAITGPLGAKMFKAATLTGIVIIDLLLIHMFWGFFLGVFYLPPKEEVIATRT
jgi:hypothetical protein